MAGAKGGGVYMMSDRYRGGIYTGVTADLAARVAQHKEGAGSAFVRQYGLTLLVHCERHEAIVDAIAAGDAPAADRALRQHISRAWETRLKLEAANDRA